MAGIYSEYFNLTKDYKSQYGENTIILMQVGAFFEVYGLKNEENGEITKSEIVQFSQICQLNMSEKKSSYNDMQIVMAGFRDYSLEKYLQKITDADFTAVVFVQEKNEKNTKRIFHSVHSAGTYISFETDNSSQITNNIMCIWFDLETVRNISLKNGERKCISGKDNILCGIAVANIFTGKSFLFEYQTPFYSNPTTFDELERYISVYSPSEIIILSPFDNNTLDTIIQYCGIKTNNIHRIDINNSLDANYKKAKRCSEQTYIHHILSTFYGEETIEICTEFQTNTYATQSFCYLMDFIQEHNPNLVRNIGLPTFNNTTDRVVLANHTLKQLNIIDDFSIDKSKNVRNLSSVLSFLNKCCCAMGKRKFQYQLLNPTFNEVWLNKEYNITEYFLLNNRALLLPIRKLIGQVCDIEKISRQLVIQKIYPSSIYSLFNSVININNIYNLIDSSQHNEINDYLYENKKNIPIICSQFCDFLLQNLDIENCKGINSIQIFEHNIIKSGVSSTLDSLYKKYNNNIKLFDTIREQLNIIIRNNETSIISTSSSSSSNTNDIEYVKVHETDKMGLSLQITKKRGLILKKILNANSSPIIVKNNDNDEFILNDIKISNASTSNDEIDCSILKKITKEILTLKERINQEITVVYSSIVKRIENEWNDSLDILVTYISHMDVLQCKVYIAQEYNYVKPKIQNDETEPFVKAYDLRHCLIEQLQKNEIYVPNDVILEEHTKGILLYGTNAVGKTSIIRALGISIILAQSGIFVPCSQFIYKPYTAVYSRILGNDNIFKGLSTFAVEMSELRTILKMADEKSLILGDELCSGTETESAHSIFVAGLLDLQSKRSNYIFATHFHEIVNYEEITNLKTLKCMHLSVYYDRELDCLVYDRKLKEGSGNRMYGLEVCKSLYLPEEFLNVAYSIRNKYHEQTRGELDKNITKYNSNKIRGVCEMCKEQMGKEIHHIREQREANEDGFIETFHKNHPANLMSVCEKCHNNIHYNKDKSTNIIKKVCKKKTTQGYKIL